MSTTTCYLKVLDSITELEIGALSDVIESCNPSDPNVLEALQERSEITFEDVLDGTMPDDLLEWLTFHQVSFKWTREPSGEIGGGIQYMQTDGTLHDFRTHENIIVVPLSMANSETVKGIQRVVAEMTEKEVLHH